MYLYTHNNPLKFVDPLGLWKQVACSGGASVCWQWEEGDTWETLSRDAGYSTRDAKKLAEFFDGTATLAEEPLSILLVLQNGLSHVQLTNS
jgi:hypothetical protein